MNNDARELLEWIFANCQVTRKGEPIGSELEADEAMTRDADAREADYRAAKEDYFHRN